MKIKGGIQIQQSISHISRAGGQSRPSADTKSPDSRGLQSWNLHLASVLTLMKLWRMAENPKRNTGAWSHASKCCWTNPISSLTGVLLMTFTILTAADQNNTYLFMHASRNHVCSKEVYIPGKKKTDISQALWHWVSGQCAIIWELRTVTE